MVPAIFLGQHSWFRGSTSYSLTIAKYYDMSVIVNCQVLRHVRDCGARFAFTVSGIHATTVTRAEKQTSQS